ncbi:esterase-like activity of phytase family protein [Christiangramia echinicola]|uniref:esterase-like activity of phytase family protein n=1 Tax=Christiangramia echinicola TaxID=279359 RepID=UPI0004051B48|nr:esterase-like activity of phytase family protein [Christiangramia echinicola]
MKKTISLILLSLVLASCAVTRKIENDNIEIRFLDEYVLPSDIEIENTIVGGLSGIDYQNGKYYLVSDQSSNPRIYIANIDLDENKIQNFEIEQLITVKKSNEFKDKVLDLEAIRYNRQKGDFIVTSEGLIDDGKDPGIYSISILGETYNSFSIPEYFKAKDEQKPRNNGVFEGITESSDKKAYWVAMESPLEKDGSKPKIFPSRAHIRITKFDKLTGLPLKQFAYKLDGIAKLPINYFAVNGATEILAYAQDKFLILERSYSAGYGSHGNTVKIFEVDASQATNTLELDELKGQDYKIADKKLLFNFKSVKKQLTNEIIDNIEGMCLGPKLENGKQSLILVSDNNFNSFAEQINQIILMEINFKNL